MKQPIIGITTTRKETGENTRISCQENYIRAILAAGGVPILIPLGLENYQQENLIDHLDGIMLTGGGDIQLKYFNGPSHPTVSGIIPDRDEIEISLANLAIENKIPLLGICRGVQVLNVALGGTLYTDIPSQFGSTINHNTKDDNPWPTIAHTVKIEQGSLLQKIIKHAEIGVNSRHHQAVLIPGHDAVPTAFAPDGLIEAIEVKDLPFCVGVQWHPEGLPDDVNAKALFCAFVEAALSYQTND